MYLPRTTSYKFLAPCQSLEKNNVTIPRKRLDRWKGGHILFHRAFLAAAGGPITLTVFQMLSSEVSQ